MKKEKMKYRLIKILCVGIIIGALLGMLLMGLNGRKQLKAVRAESKKTENKLKKEKEKLQVEVELAQMRNPQRTLQKRMRKNWHRMMMTGLWF